MHRSWPAHIILLILLAWLSAPPIPAQSRDNPQPRTDEVVRVNTELAQTDVLVLDKNGQFVVGLTREQLQFRVNGKPRTVSFLDRITAGSQTEEQQIAAARGQSAIGARLAFGDGRTIFFFVDDCHLSSESVRRTREMLTHFLDNYLLPEDHVAIVTATGQLGFLEQLTNEPNVLRRAVTKLSHRNFVSTDAERTPMNETEAAAISMEDRRVLDYFVDQLLREMGRRPRGPTPPSKTRGDAEQSVRARARAIMDQSTALSVQTLTGLRRLIELTDTMPWRKTLFFVSDGFAVYDRSNPGTDVSRIIKAAALGLTVIYSIDAQGLVTGLTPASRKLAFNIGRLNTGALNTTGITAVQETLQTLAADTGGTALLNSNTPISQIDDALGEMSNYYLLSWRPEEKEISDNRDFVPIEVSIVDRPDLIVRTRQKFFSAARLDKPEKKPSKSKAAVAEKPLDAALHGFAPKIDLPVSMSLGYSAAAAGTSVMATIEIPLRALESNGEESRELQVMAACVDENGKPVKVSEQGITVKPDQIKSSRSESVIYNHEFSLTPGLYQVRVAVLDKKANRIGSAMQWIDIPNLKEDFNTSSLFIGEVDSASLQSGKLSLNAAHRFRAGATLGFFLVVYNAGRNSTDPDVALQVQIFRDQQPVVTKPLVKLVPAPSAPPNAMPYGEDVVLQGLPAGKYVLQVTAIDRIAKKSSHQRVRFLVY